MYRVTIKLMSGRSISRDVAAGSEERAIATVLSYKEVKEFINGESPIAITADEI